MVQHGKDTIKNERVQGPPKGEHKQLQLKLLLLRMLLRTLKKMDLRKEIETYAEKVSAGMKTAEAPRAGVSMATLAPISLLNSSKEGADMVQHRKDAMKNKRVQGSAMLEPNSYS